MNPILPINMQRYTFRTIFLFYQIDYLLELDNYSNRALFFIDTRNRAGKLINLKIFVEEIQNNFSFNLSIKQSEAIIDFDTVYFYKDCKPLLFDTDINAYYFNKMYKRTNPDYLKKYLLEGYETSSERVKENRLYEGLYLYIESPLDQFKRIHFSVMMEDLDASRNY